VKRYAGDERSEKQKARDANNRGTKGHGQPLHHTTDPKLHLKRAREAIRNYLEDLKRRNAHAKNTHRQSAARTRHQDARLWAKELQSSYRKSHQTAQDD
jgi:hypothetical protein